LLHKADGKLVGCGFIQFVKKNSAAKAILSCSGKPLLGEILLFFLVDLLLNSRVRWLTPLLPIWEVLGLNLVPETGCLNRVFIVFLTLYRKMLG
jgi:hypothetical protein